MKRLIDKYLSLLLFLLLLLFVYAGKRSDGGQINQFPNSAQQDSVVFKEIRFDPNSPGYTNESVASSDIFESVEFVPLETTSQSVFGQIDQMEITEKYFIILDQRFNTIFLFTKDGKFYGNITNKGKHKKGSKFKAIECFTVDRQNNQIIFYDNMTGKMFYYTIEGEYIKEMNTVFDFQDFKYLDNGKVLYYGIRSAYSPGENKPKGIDPCNLIIADVEMKHIERELLPFDTTFDWNKIYEIPNSVCRNNNSLFVSQPYDYKIYQIEENGIRGGYSLILPMINTIPADFFTNDKYMNKWVQYLDPNNNNIIFGMGNIYQSGNTLTFNLQPSIMQYSPYLYNIKTEALYSFPEIDSDSSTYYLPLGEDFVGVDNDDFITRISAASLIDAYCQIPKNIIKDNPNPKINALIKALKNVDNPVLIKLNPKAVF